MPPGDYQVDQSADVTAQFRALADQARAEGQLPWFVRASRWAMEELARTPMEFGESREFYPDAGIQARIAFVGPLVIRFGVREQTRTVFLRSFQLSRRRPRPFLPSPPTG